ncbi:MAG: transcription-repair coupling factor [Planctomycetota bacterium]
MLNTSIYDSIISDLVVNREVKIGGLWGSSSLYLIAQLYSQLQPGIKHASLLFQSQPTRLRHSGGYVERTFLLITNDIESIESAFDDLSTFLTLSSPPEEGLPQAQGSKKKTASEKGNGSLKDNIIICSEEEKDSNGELTPKSIQEKLLFSKRLSSRKNKIVICSQFALFASFPNPKELIDSILHLKKGQSLNRGEFLEDLMKNGYKRITDVVTEVGEIGIRGGILDIFPYGLESPLRIEWGVDHIESIRFFDADSQLSTNPIDEISFYLTQTKSLFAKSSEITLFDYFNPNTIIVFMESQMNYSALLSESSKHRMLSEDDNNIINQKTQKYPRLYLYNFPITTQEGHNLSIQSLQRFGGGFTNIIKELTELSSKAKWVNIFSQNKAEEARLKELLVSNSFPEMDKIKLYQGRFREGFYFREIKTAFISHHELFNRYRLLKRTKTSSSKLTKAIEPFWELKKGDFAVHNSYGIGRYLGLKRLHNSEFMVLEYQDKSLVYVSITQMNLVSKYWGSDRRAVSIDRIGSNAWAMRKERVKNVIKKLSIELLYIQAIRLKKLGFAYPADTEWQREFESSFPYDETPDQTSITQVLKEDMENPKPMDRLICGDVGYGKTELAMRTAFKACLAGKQVAIIAPTTILAQQHYQTFSERMADYPVNIDVISRFKTDSEQKDIIKLVAEGKIDIIIGTHRLVQGDIKFKDLGLVIIDEEQRFGVEHKEYFKKIKANVDVLTLSATPIPRTLHLALSGLREISTMTTPPQDRQAIQTIVCRFDDEIIKNAIIRELNRNGQIYFVHNRIFDIEKIADRIKKLLPQLNERVIIAHGQMPGSELEHKMQDFINGKYDILISTNIIESGLDIPRVNTIFVNNADDFGLSDLHQLRGRVGRYKYQAYAYFIIPPEAVIGSDARKRLKAIEEFNELGAGFKIAMRDMEIRGIGNILGKEQHGHIAAIGYELYCRLIEKAVKQIKGSKEFENLTTKIQRTQRIISVDSVPQWQSNMEVGDEKPANDINLKIDTFLPADYIDSEKQRLEIYRRLSMATAESKRSPDYFGEESVISDIYKEVKDRFGPVPSSAENLFKLMKLKIRLVVYGISSLVQAEDSVHSQYTKNVLIIIKMENEDSNPSNKWMNMMKEKYPQAIKIIDEKTIHLNLPLKLSAQRDRLVLENLIKLLEL